MADLADPVLDQISTDVTEQEKQERKKIYEAAQKFIKQLEQNLSQQKFLLEMLQRKKVIIDTFLASSNTILTIENIYSQYLSDFIATLNNYDTLKNIYSAYFSFQNIINQILHQEVMVIEVAIENGNPVLYDITKSSMDEVFVGDKTSAGKATLRYRVPEKASQVKGLVNTQHQAIDLTFQDVSARYAIARSYHYKKAAGLPIVMYKPNGQWEGARVQSQGSINQAYAEYVLLNLQEYHYSKNNTVNNIFKAYNREHRVKLFVLGGKMQAFSIILHGQKTVSGIIGVDSVSGLLQGDISVQGSNAWKIEYAIKSKGATVLKISKGIELAAAIISKQGQFSKDDLINYQEALKKDAHLLNAELENGSDVTAIDAIAEYIGANFEGWSISKTNIPKNRTGGVKIDIALQDAYSNVSALIQGINSVLGTLDSYIQNTAQIFPDQL